MDELTKQCVAIRDAIGVPSNWIGTEFELVGCALEAVITDEQTREAGLWQGDLLPRALANLQKLVEQYCPIPVSERLPPNKPDCDSESIDVLAYCPGSEHWGGAALYYTSNGKQWLWDNDRTSGDPTHWLPMPPSPSEPASKSSDTPCTDNSEQS